jgi:hypothetical protein
MEEQGKELIIEIQKIAESHGVSFDEGVKLAVCILKAESSFNLLEILDS